jgi:hypothetical protein
MLITELQIPAYRGESRAIVTNLFDELGRETSSLALAHMALGEYVTGPQAGRLLIEPISQLQLMDTFGHDRRGDTDALRAHAVG